ncbi:hypothetical protein TNCV_3083791 [Trichonephila clavipes]|nr:hypothetical protein TNCV_3083791 [Trichonephila clavipes]
MQHGDLRILLVFFNCSSAPSRVFSSPSPDAVLDPRHSRSDSQRAPTQHSHHGSAVDPLRMHRGDIGLKTSLQNLELAITPTRENSHNALRVLPSPQRMAGTGQRRPSPRASRPSLLRLRKSSPSTFTACITAFSGRLADLLGLKSPPSIGLTDTSLRHTEDFLGVYSQIPCLVSQSAQQTTSIRGLSELIIAVPLVCPGQYPVGQTFS